LFPKGEEKPMTNDDLVGVWRERGREIVHADGTVEADVPRASQIMYTPDGYMAVVNAPMERSRVNEKSPRMDLDAASAAERAEAAIGVVAYAGSYEVAGEEVRHHLFTAINPNRVGDTQRRHIILKGDDLTLAAPPDAQGNFFRIHWRRAAKMT
jgi:hypothetical protein